MILLVLQKSPDFVDQLKNLNKKVTSNKTKHVLELKKDKCTEYIIGWNSKGLSNSKLMALHGAFLSNIKYFRKKIGIQFSSTPLVIEQNIYTTKIVNVYIVYDLEN